MVPTPEGTREIAPELIESSARAARDLFFAPFRIDGPSGRLWSGATELSIRPKAFAVLRHLAENAGRLVTARELVHVVWADSHGSAPLVKGCVRELRQLLGDDAVSPRYIETVGRRGYLFTATAEPTSGSAAPPVRGSREPHGFVGRAAELEYLHGWLGQALARERQIVFVTGEPGIGKTKLVEHFLDDAQSRHDLHIARGRCVEHYGSGEPYLPILEALARSCRGPGGERVIDVLSRFAPTWLAGMPSLLSEAARKALAARIEGVNRERMLHEICEAMEALAAERPLVLWLDDLHWSDPSTIDLIASLASRSEPARLLLLATYRPAEVVIARHPLRSVRRELEAHGRGHALALGLLGRADVEAYLRDRFPASELPPELSVTLAEITDGNPLFLSAVVEDLVHRGIFEDQGSWSVRGRFDLVAAAIPDSLRQLIEEQVDRLETESQQILEAASVSGREFVAGAIAVALGASADDVDGRLESLTARAHLVDPKGLDSAPQRGSSGRYAFVHALYSRVLYGRIPASRRARLHRRLGEAQEAAWGDRAPEIAAELARHFDSGGDATRAVRHLRLAAENAARKLANAEAIAHLGRALELVERLPNLDRPVEEVTLRMALGPLLMTSRGYASPEVDQNYRRAGELAGRIANRPDVYPTLRALHRISLVRADLAAALPLARKCLAMAKQSRDQHMLLEALLALGETHFYRGELGAAKKHLEAGFRLRAAARLHPPAFRVQDPGIAIRLHLGFVASLEGRESDVRAGIRLMLDEARELGHPFSLVYAQIGALCLYPLLRDPAAARVDSEATMSLAADHGFSLFVTSAHCFHGWARAVGAQDKAGVAEIEEGIAGWRAAGATLFVPYLLGLLAEANRSLGLGEAARSSVEMALEMTKRTRERWWEAPLLRLQGELLAERALGLRGARRAEARRRASALLESAALLARRQGATALAEGIRVSLVKLRS